jgi:DNA-binding NarL/FixJ family response regulator
MAKTKILIADDHGVVIDGIKQALSDHSQFEVVGEAFDGYQAIEQAEALKPDIVIMDISMPGLNGIESTLQMKKSCPDTRIIVFTMHSNKEYIVDLFRGGISGYVLKSDPTSDLILAIMAVKQGGTYFSRNTSAILQRHMNKLEEGKVSEDGFDSLSLREREIFCLLAEGKSIKEIAGQLYISPKTVGSHKYNIMGKLDTPTITDLVKVAIKKNLIQLQDFP